MRIYTVGLIDIAFTAASTLIELTAAANRALWILEAHFAQSTVTASEMQRIRGVRISAAGTGGTAVTPVPHQPQQGGAGFTAVRSATTGTLGDVMVPDVMQMANRWQYVPIPEARIYVPPSGIFAFTLPAAPAASRNFSGRVVVGELG